jgi:hypothetical protein
MHTRVDLPDGSYTLMPEEGDRGVDGDVHYVAIEQDLDRSPEGPKANLANKGKPGSSLTNFVFLNNCNYLCL